MNAPVSPASAKAQARRQQILDAASECALRYGFHGASMAQIAKTAGLSVGQIYRYFENKEAIIAAIVDQNYAEIREKFAEMEKSDSSMAAFLTATCPAAVDRNYEPKRAALTMEVLAEAARNPKAAAIVQDADAAERARVRALVSRSHNDQAIPADIDARIEVVFMLFEGMLMRSVHSPNSDRTAIVRVLQSIWPILLAEQSPDVKPKR